MKTELNQLPEFLSKSSELSQGLPPLTERELQQAYFHWEKPIATLRADAVLEKNDSVSLKMAREALLISTNEMARRMNITAVAYRKLETNAADGTVTIQSLKRAVEALDCELIIQIRPRGGETFLDRIWRPLLAKAKAHVWMQRCSRLRRGGALGWLLNETFRDPKFRREQKWTRLIDDRPKSRRASRWDQTE